MTQTQPAEDVTPATFLINRQQALYYLVELCQFTPPEANATAYDFVGHWVDAYVDGVEDTAAVFTGAITHTLLKQRAAMICHGRTFHNDTVVYYDSNGNPFLPVASVS